MKKPPILYFDGHCVLCLGSVQWILREERSSELHFSHVQGDRAKRVFPEFLVETDSLVLEENERFYIHSDAALRLVKYLKWYWQWLRLFILLPRFFRDAVYRFIAANRYKFIGKYRSCMIPDSLDRSRFLETVQKGQGGDH